MLSPFEPLTSITKANLDAALKIASRTAECAERLVRLQVDASNEIVSASDENFRAFLSKPATATSLMSSWPSVYQNNLQKVLEVGRRYIAEVSKTQTEVTQLIGEQVTAINQNAIKNLEDLTKTAMEESEKALRAVEQPGKEKRAA
jgi:hypothetical protein